MNANILGIHHITAIAGDPQANLDFYSGTLGLRLVKLTVNFDDPGTYHLYYGDGVGSPGTILTFFPWPTAPRGRRGTGQVTATAFAIPAGAVDFWRHRLQQHGVTFDGPAQRFGEDVLSFADPDGMVVELIATTRALPERAYQLGPIPLEHAIRGFHSATLAEAALKDTASLLTGTMGFTESAAEGDRRRYTVARGEPGAFVDVLDSPGQPAGRVLVGSVHHIAWRTPDDAAQSEWLAELKRLGHGVSPVMDRKYFHSIYFREPGGVLFEIATDSPGFAVDEPKEQLGTSLVLPPWLEPQRAKLQAVLPALKLPVQGQLVS